MQHATEILTDVVSKSYDVTEGTPHSGSKWEMKDKIQQMNDTQYVRCSMEDMLYLVKQDRSVWDFINQNYICSIERIQVLQEIIYSMGKQRKEELENKIYLYGSLIGDQDLIARQLFLWLLSAVEHGGGPDGEKRSQATEN